MKRALKGVRQEEHGALDLFPEERSVAALAEAARDCRACPLWKDATQTVFGEGPPDASPSRCGPPGADRGSASAFEETPDRGSRRGSGVRSVRNREEETLTGRERRAAPSPARLRSFARVLPGAPGVLPPFPARGIS